MNMNKKYKIQLIISFALLFYSVIEVLLNPSQKYELSIYSYTPFSFWFSIIVNLISGFYFVILYIFRKKNTGIIGLIQLIFGNVLVLSLYSLRGYQIYMGRCDVLSYIGMVVDINNNGEIGENIYPITSIFISELIKITNLNTLNISKIIPILFYCFYLLSIYILSKTITKNKTCSILCTLSALPLFFTRFSTSIYHEILSVYTIPFFLYLFHKNKIMNNKLCLIIIYCIIYPLYHPITSVTILLYLLSSFYMSYIKRDDKRIKTTTLISPVLFFMLLTWFSYQQYLLIRLKGNIFQILGYSVTPSSANLSLYYIDRLGIFNAIRGIITFSDEIIYYFLSLFAIIFILEEMKHNDKLMEILFNYIIGSFFIVFSFLFLRIHTPQRLIDLNINMVLSPIIVGFLLNSFFNKNKYKSILILSLVFSSIFITIFTLYPSPFIVRPNDQVTKMDIKGMHTLINKKDADLHTAHILTPEFRFADLLYGKTFRIQREDIIAFPKALPDHFGFNNKPIFPINEDKYLVISKYDIDAYTKVWTNIDRFDKKDFEKINFCFIFKKLYDNGEFLIYKITKVRY